MVSTHTNPSRDDFAAMLEESFNKSDSLEGSVIKGRIVAIEKDMAVVDLGLKTEGRVALREFTGPGREGAPGIGDEVEVYLDRIENALGEAVISRDKARREESWVKLEKAFEAGEKVNGVIFNVVKGGYTVDLDGATAFLPRSQVDIRPIRDVGPLMNIAQPFQILKMDRRRGNIVVSRRTVLEETRAEARTELVANLEEGQTVDGTVKNITEYGAFVDLGGIDGLLHVTDMAWRRVNHPSEVVTIGQQLKVKIIKINHDTHRISLGIKQLLTDPWEGIEAKYPINGRLKGRVTNITDYGAFVELEPGIEGLIHVSEMSWTKRNVRAADVVKPGEQVEVVVLEVKPADKRIGLGLKQALGDPWEEVLKKHPVGSVVEAPVTSLAKFGAFVDLGNGIEGMVHIGDISREKRLDHPNEMLKVGQVVKAKVTEADRERRRLRLSIKELEPTSADNFIAEHKVGDVITGRIVDVSPNRLKVELGEGVSGIAKLAEKKQEASSGGSAKADVSALSAMLTQRWKTGGGVDFHGSNFTGRHVLDEWNRMSG